MPNIVFPAYSGSFILSSGDGEYLTDPSGYYITDPSGDNIISTALIFQGVGLIYGKKIEAESGTLRISGSDISLTAARRIPVSYGSMAMSGSAVDLVKTSLDNKTLSCAGGSMSMSGSSVHLSVSRRMHADGYDASLTGAELSITASRLLEIACGSIALTGQSVDLLKFRPGTLECGSGSFTVAWYGTANLIKIIKGNRVILVSHNRTVKYNRRDTEIIYPVSRRAA